MLPVRAHQWWSYKLAPLFAVSLLATNLALLPPAVALPRLVACLFLTGLAVGSYGFFVNDLFDIDLDRDAGRRNAASRVPRGLRLPICGVLVVGTFVPTLWVPFGAPGYLLITLELLVVTIYSAPPLRLKTRGMAGVVADALGAHLLPALFLLACFSRETHLIGSWAGATLLMGTTLWSTGLGVRGIVTHQLMDAPDDERQSTATFVTAGGAQAANALLRQAYPFEIVGVVLTAVATAARAPQVATALGLYSILEGLKKLWLGWQHRLGREPYALEISHRPLWNNYYYELWLPVAAVISLALHETTYAILLPAFVIAFYPNVRAQVADLGVLGVEIVLRLRAFRATRGWALDVDVGCKAVLSTGRVFELAVHRTTGDPWVVRLRRHVGRVTSGQAFEVSFAARAPTAPAILYVAVTRAQPPWDNLGIYERCELDSSWRHYRISGHLGAGAEKAYCVVFAGAGATVALLERPRISRRGRG